MLIDNKKIRTDSFWFYQITGWIIFYSADVFLMLFVRERNFMGFIEETLEDLIVFLLTLLLRSIYKQMKYHDFHIPKLIGVMLFWSILFTWFSYTSFAGLVAVFSSLKDAMVMLQLKQIATWLFIFTPVYFGWSSLYFGVKYWLDWKSQRARAENARHLAQRAQLQMLRYQLNPHFLFNTLNSIRALMMEDPKKAKGMITDFSEFLRYSLLSGEKEQITLKDELETIHYYFSIQQKRFENNLIVNYEIDPAAENFTLFSFLLHPIVENAIKYGMRTSQMPLRVNISASIHDGNLVIEIKNSGKWIHASQADIKSSTGTGLENVRARLENSFPGSYRLETFEENGYVHVKLEVFVKGLEADMIPLKHSEQK